MQHDLRDGLGDVHVDRHLPAEGGRGQVGDEGQPVVPGDDGRGEADGRVTRRRRRSGRGGGVGRGAHPREATVAGVQPDDDAAQDADGALHVVGVGNALVDVLSSATDDDLTRLGLLKGTMALVDAERSRRIYEVMGPTVESSGGSAANTVAGVAALGGRAAFLGRVADDPLGRTFIHDIRSAGVAFEPMAPKAGAGDGDGDGARGGEGDGDGDGSGTGHCLVLVTPDAERTMATHLGVASDFSHVDLHDGHLTSARVAYFEGYLWEQAQARAAMRTAMARAHAADATVALSLSDPVCVSHHRREWLDLLTGEVDLVFANEEEVVMLFGVHRLRRRRGGRGRDGGAGRADPGIARVGGGHAHRGHRGRRPPTSRRSSTPPAPATCSPPGSSTASRRDWPRRNRPCSAGCVPPR